MNSILIENGIIITLDKFGRIIKNGAVYIENNIIRDIGETKKLKKEYNPDFTINAANSIVMPGFVNSHVHLTSSLLRGMLDDLSLKQWDKIQTLPPEKEIREGIIAASKLVCLEMIKAGVTSYIGGAHEGEIGKTEIDVRYRSGLRGFLAFSIINKIGNYKDILNHIRDNYSDRIQLLLGPWWTLKVPKEILIKTGEIAEKHNLKISIHVAETSWEIKEIKRKTRCEGAIDYLNHIGLLSPRLIAVHCVHISKKEVDLMQKSRTKVVHCPVSNAKLGDGIAPLTKFLKAGITVGLGSDGVATNNCIDMFQEMKVACLLQRAIHQNPQVMSAEEVLKMATLNGAKLLGVDKKLGSIEVGKKADLIIVDIKKPHFYPITNPVTHIVYSAKASDVNTVIIDGKLIMKNRNVITMNEEEILKEVQEIHDSIFPNKQLQHITSKPEKKH